MNLCDYHHDKICFEGHHCPLCEMRTAYEDQLADEKARTTALKEEIKQMEEDYYPCQHAECEAWAALEKP